MFKFQTEVYKITENNKYQPREIKRLKTISITSIAQIKRLTFYRNHTL